MDSEEQSLKDLLTIEPNKSLIENILDYRNFQVSPKDTKLSIEFRKKGSTLYDDYNHDEDKHRDAFDFYCRSVAHALPKSQEEALALEKLSQLMEHTEKYEESSKIVDRALSFAKTADLRIKLLCRKVKCLKKSGVESYRNSLEEARTCCSSIEDNFTKSQCEALIKDAETMQDYSRSDQRNINDRNPQKIKKQKVDHAGSLSRFESDPFEKIAIKYNEKYGRHLEAKKDLEAGDVVWVKKPYSVTCKEENIYLSCNYCLKMPWLVVTCDKCNWAVYCSDECRTKAWSEHHDLECFTFAILKNFEEETIEDFVANYRVAVRCLIKGFKEFGSLTELRKIVETMDNNADPCKGLVKEGRITNIDSIEAVYFLSRNRIYPDSDILSYCKDYVPSILIVTIAFLETLNGCNFFSSDFKTKKIDELKEDKDVLFLSLFLMKLCVITDSNAHCYFNRHKEALQKLEKHCPNLREFTSISTITSLMNHSCFPNIEHIYEDDGRIVAFALQPIKANSQLFDTYTQMYHRESFESRQNVLKNYNFTCDCAACLENWPELWQPVTLNYTRPPTLENVLKAAMTNESSTMNNILSYTNDIAEALYSEKIDTADESMIKLLSKGISESLRELVQPSILTVHLIETLLIAMTLNFGQTDPTFGLCDKSNDLFDNVQLLNEKMI